MTRPAPWHLTARYATARYLARWHSAVSHPAQPVPDMAFALLLAALALGIAVLDVHLPGRHAVVVLFVLVVILSGQLPRASHVVVAAGGCIALVAVTYVVRHGPDATPAFLFRRGLCVIGIVLAALLTLRNQALQRQQRQQALLLDVAGDAISIRDAAGLVTWWSAGAEDIYGWTRRQAIGRRIATLLPGAARGTLAGAAAALATQGQWQGELCYDIAGRGRVTVLSRWTARHDRDGRIAAILQTDTDITADKAAEARIQASEARFRGIFDTTAAAICEADFAAVRAMIAGLRAQGVTDFAACFRDHPERVEHALTLVRIIDVNATAVTLFEATDKAALMRALNTVFLPVTRLAFADLLAALAGGEPGYHGETTVLTFNGATRAVLVSVSFPAPAGGIGPAPMDHALVSLLDVTARWQAGAALREAEDALARASRIATLGALTASIAQGVEQPLVAVVAQGEAAILALQDPDHGIPAVRTLIEAAIIQGRQAAAVVARVRGLLGAPQPGQAPLDLRRMIEAALLLLRPDLLHHRIELRLALAAGLPQVVGDRARIEQAIIHLLLTCVRALVLPVEKPRCLAIRLRQPEQGLVLLELEAVGVASLLEQVDGADIGWEVARSGIEASGGRILVLPGQSATIRVTLPSGPNTIGLGTIGSGIGEIENTGRKTAGEAPADA